MEGVLALTIPIVAILSVMVLTGLKSLIRHKERMAELSSGSRAGPSGTEVEARLLRLEQSIETLSIEVERNGEAQRYLTKVLAKHLPAEAQEQLPKVPLS